MNKMMNYIFELKRDSEDDYYIVVCKGLLSITIYKNNLIFTWFSNHGAY